MDNEMDSNCHVVRFDKEVALEEADQQQLKQVTLHIFGMGCINCANRVHNSLIDHPGVVSAKVSHETAQALVTFIPTKINIYRLSELVAEGGDNRHRYLVVHVDTVVDTVKEGTE
ncbi:MAG: cation transporter [Anaerolineae bacterium]|nr:cation transporter [Anaerolineae bacterium]